MVAKWLHAFVGSQPAGPGVQSPLPPLRLLFFFDFLRGCFSFSLEIDWAIGQVRALTPIGSRKSLLAFGGAWTLDLTTSADEQVLQHSSIGGYEDNYTSEATHKATEKINAVPQSDMK